MSHPASKLRSIKRSIEAANQKSKPPDEVNIRDAFWGEIIDLYQTAFGVEATTQFITRYRRDNKIIHPISDALRKEMRDAYSLHIIKELNNHICSRQALVDACTKYNVNPISG